MSQAPRPHHLNAPVVDVLPVDVAAEINGGLIDVYLDLNTVTWQRVRLTADVALSLYRQLGERISHLPIRLKDNEL